MLSGNAARRNTRLEAMKPLVVSIKQTGELMGGIYRATVYRLINKGELEDVRVGGRRLVIMSSIEERLATAQPVEQAT